MFTTHRSDLRESKFSSLYWNPWFWHPSQSFYSHSDTETQWETDLGKNCSFTICNSLVTPKPQSRHLPDRERYGYWVYSPYRMVKAPQVWVATAGLKSQWTIFSLKLLSTVELVWKLCSSARFYLQLTPQAEIRSSLASQEKGQTVGNVAQFKYNCIKAIAMSWGVKDSSLKSISEFLLKTHQKRD